jgi:hypothetical protein
MFEFDHILTLKEEQILSQGTFLWIFHAHKIPPHIGISSNGIFFSLKANGKDERVNFQKVLNIIHTKKIATLFVEFTGNQIETIEIEDVFKRFSKAITGESTCLTPVVECVLSEPRDLILKELLKLLVEKKYMGTVFSLHLDENYRGIPDYSREEIANRINALHAVKRTKHISEGH